MALRSRCGVRGQCRGQRELPLRPPHPHSVQTALPALQLPVSCSAQLSEHESRVSRVRVVCQAASVDPLTQQQGEYQPGKTFIIHSNDDLAKFTQGDKTKAKLTVLMAKSSHCRPCKKFISTYYGLAELFRDSQLLEVVGDESPTTRKMMVDMKVRVTPTFFLYRDGEVLTTLTGTGRGQLRRAIIEHLKAGEAGKDASPSESSGSTTTEGEQTIDDD